MLAALHTGNNSGRNDRSALGILTIGMCIGEVFARDVCDLTYAYSIAHVIESRSGSVRGIF